MKQLFITIGTLILSSILYGQAGGVGINNNGTAPNASAMLDIESTSKGLLVPRVALTNTTDATTIVNGNVTSLLVYNTATIADVVPGYYYWDGSVWKTLGGDADADPSNEIQDLQIVGNNLTITNNGAPTTIDLSPYLDNTDDQNIDSVSLNGNNLTVYIENGTAATVDLSALASDHDWYETGGTSAPDNINDTIYTMGNVGIGEVLPKAELDVNGDIIFGGTASSLEWQLSSGPGIFRLKNGPNYNSGEIKLEGRSIGGTGSNFQLVIDDASSQLYPNYSFISDNNTGIFNRPASPDNLYFSTNGIERQVIDANGNVGIGTTTPTDKLNVHGAILSTGENTWGAVISESFSGTAVHNGVFVSRNARGSKSSPTYSLSGDIMGQLTYRNHTNTFGADIASFATENHSATNAGSNLTFWTIPNGGNNTFTRMTISENGNVGIGTTSPSELLELQGGSIKIVDGTQGANKVLMSDGAGKGSWQTLTGAWMGYLSGGSSSAGIGGEVSIDFTSASVIGQGGSSSATTDNITVPVTGTYRIMVSGWGSGVISPYLIYWRAKVNGVNAWGPHYSGASSTWGTNLSSVTILNLNAGDIISLYRDTFTAGGSYDGDTSGVIFSVELIQ
ncbi:MAG: hypothetical protein N4A35_07065 [Flavobacteriales bacterium]|jgi:hypothetical protein|nr:hypothetical protein [Flavobacteriales bacterium]